jgi:hypothetical protein
MITGLLAALVLGYAVWRVALGYPSLRRSYGALTRGEVAFVSAAGEAMYPAGGAIASSGLDADLPDYVDRFLRASAPRIRLLLHLLFHLVEHATVFFPAPGRAGLRRFSALDAEQRVAVLDGWADSSLFARRLVFTSLRAVLTMGYFAHPPVLRELGLAPLAIDTPICEADLLYPRIGEHPATIGLTRAELTPPSDGIPLALDGALRPGFAEPRE